VSLEIAKEISILQTPYKQQSLKMTSDGNAVTLVTSGLSNGKVVSVAVDRLDNIYFVDEPIRFL